MRITAVDTTLLRLPEVSANGDGLQDLLLIEVRTDEGVVGLGEAHTMPTALRAVIEAPVSQLAVQGLAHLVVGEDPRDIESIWQKMWRHCGSVLGGRGLVLHAMSGIDLALWDLAGKLADRPLCDLLGGRRHDVVDVYASDLMPSDRAALIDRATALARAGHTAIKFGWGKLGASPAEDIDVLAAVREALGPGVRLMVDVGVPMPFDEAVWLANALEPLGVTFLEEPLDSTDFDGYAALVDASPIPIAAGEREGGEAGFRDLLARGAPSRGAARLGAMRRHHRRPPHRGPGCRGGSMARAALLVVRRAGRRDHALPRDPRPAAVARVQRDGPTAADRAARPPARAPRRPAGAADRPGPRDRARSCGGGSVSGGTVSERGEHRREESGGWVDAAVHIWSDDRVGYPFAPHDGHELPTMGGSVERLLQTLDDAGAVGAVCVQPRVYGYDHGYLIDALRRHADRLVGVALVNPVRRAGPDELRRLVGEHGFGGVRLLPLASNDAPWLTDPSGDALWQTAAALGVPVSVLVRPEQLDRLRTRARRVDARVVVDHLGLVSRPGAALDDLLSLAAVGNVTVKVSALTDLATNSAPESVAHVVAAVLSEFGDDRVMFGTDWPYALEHGGWSAARAVLDTALAGRDVGAGLRGGTAMALWPALAGAAPPCSITRRGDGRLVPRPDT